MLSHKKFLIVLTLLCKSFSLSSQEKLPVAKTEIWTIAGKDSLPATTELLAKELNQDLNGNPLFYTPFLKNLARVHEYLLDKNNGKGTQLQCQTEDGQTIQCTYFNRSSDTLLVVGSGFTNPQEYMAPFVGMFDCDILLFDYRGHGFKESKWYNPFSWKLKPAQILFDLDGSKVKMGEVEHLDVIAAIETLRNLKSYKQICGLGVCYSAPIFIKAQTIYKQKNNTNLFDKLICDGTWLSLKNQVSRIRNDMKLINNPQQGGCYKKWPLSKPWFSGTILWFAEFLSRIQFSKLNFNVLDYLEGIDIPILFIHGKDDLFVPLNEFKEIWKNTTNTEEKVAIITKNPHVRNHFKQKELYKFLCDSFMVLPYDIFIQHLYQQNCILDYQFKKFQTKLQRALEII